MSSKDKTRNKLMGSMRKTKADAGIDSKAGTQATASKKAASKPSSSKAST